MGAIQARKSDLRRIHRSLDEVKDKRKKVLKRLEKLWNNENKRLRAIKRLNRGDVHDMQHFHSEILRIVDRERRIAQRMEKELREIIREVQAQRRKLHDFYKKL